MAANSSPWTMLDLKIVPGGRESAKIAARFFGSVSCATTPSMFDLGWSCSQTRPTSSVCRWPDTAGELPSFGLTNGANTLSTFGSLPLMNPSGSTTGLVPLSIASLPRSMGECPCLAETTISVESSRWFASSALTIRPREASTCAIAPASRAVGVPAASAYPPTGSFCPTLTSWKFMPKMFGTGAPFVPSALLPLIWLTTADLVQRQRVGRPVALGERRRQVDAIDGAAVGDGRVAGDAGDRHDAH